MKYTMEYEYYNDEGKPCHKEEHDTVINLACAMMRLTGHKMVEGQTYRQYVIDRLKGLGLPADGDTFFQCSRKAALHLGFKDTPGISTFKETALFFLYERVEDICKPKPEPAVAATGSSGLAVAALGSSEPDNLDSDDHISGSIFDGSTISGDGSSPGHISYAPNGNNIALGDFTDSSTMYIDV